MLTIRSNIDELYALPALNGDKFSLEISSDDSKSSRIVMAVISQVFSESEIVYKAYGLPNSMKEILDDLNDLNYIYHEGDGRKFYLKKYPEIILRLNNNLTVEKLLKSWVCSAYEGRFFYIAKPQCAESIQEYFQNSPYKDEDCLDELWDFLLCVIKSIPESNEHDSFIVTARSSFNTEIKRIVLDYL